MGRRRLSWKSLLASLVALATASPAAATFGSNLVVNGDAETGTINQLPTGWSATGPNAGDFITSDAYFGENVQTFHGKVLELYHHNPNREATLFQIIDVSSLQSQISAGHVALSFSAQGFTWYGSSASYTVEQLNSSNVVLRADSTGVFGLPRQDGNYHTTDSSACTWTTSTLTSSGLNSATAKLKVSIYAKTSNIDDDYVDFDNIQLILSAPPTVSTTAVTTYGRNSATLGGNATADNGATVSERGVVYSSTDATPMIGESGVVKEANDSAIGSFSESIGSLAAGTTYHVRAYATNSAGTTYGSVVDFTTAAPPSIGAVTAPVGATYAAGQNLDYTVSFGEVVNVVTTGGTPYLTLTVGGSIVHATYQSGSGTSALVFRYTVVSGDVDADGVALASNVTLNGGTIQDAVGNDATVTFAGGTAASVLVEGRASQSITFGALATQTYGTNFVKLMATSSSSLPVSYASSNSSVVRISNDTAYLLAADTAIITASQSGNASYIAATSVARKMTISKKPLTITGAVATGKTYDGTVSAMVTGAALSGVVNSDEVSLVLGTASFATKDTGTAKIVTVTGSSLSGAKAGNYDLTEVSGLSATISAKTVSVTADAKTKVYGAADPVLTYISSGLVGGDAISGTLSRISGEDAGNHAITLGTLSAGSNYTISYTGANLAISKKPLSITGAVASNKVYDGTVSAMVTGAALSGVVNSDDVSLVLGTASFASKDTGTAKTVTVTGSSLSGAKAGNYDLTEVSGLSATISAKTVSVTADAKSKVYGASDPVLTYTSSGLLPGDVFTGSLARATGEDAGSHAITQGALSAGNNYGISFTGADLAITKKPLSITGAVASNKVYDGTVSVTVTGAALSGVLNSDDVSLVLGTASFASKDTGTAKAVTVTGSSLAGAKAGNYELAEVSGLSATISAKTISVTADAKSKVYGASDPVLTYTSSGLLPGDVFTGSLARATGEEAGSHAITQGTLSAGNNYGISFTGADLTITKKPLTITGAVATGKTYDGTVSATVTGAALSGLVNSDDVSLVLGTASFASKDTGTAKIVTVTGSLLSGAKAGNYELAEVSGLSATISAKTVSVTADAKSKVYGTSDPALTYTSSGLLSGDAFTGSLARAAGEAVGGYAISQGSLAAGSNYAISFTGADLVIQASTALASRPTRVPLSGELDAGVAKAFSSVADLPGPGRMESSACREDVACLAVDVLLTGSAKVDVAIFDNLGVPVMAFEKVVSRSDLRRLASTGDGRWSLPVSWNLRTSRGDAVPSGVYLWRISVRTDDGQKLDIVRRLGVRNR